MVRMEQRGRTALSDYQRDTPGVQGRCLRKRSKEEVGRPQTGSQGAGHHLGTLVERHHRHHSLPEGRHNQEAERHNQEAERHQHHHRIQQQGASLEEWCLVQGTQEQRGLDLQEHQGSHLLAQVLGQGMEQRGPWGSHPDQKLVHHYWGVGVRGTRQGHFRAS